MTKLTKCPECKQKTLPDLKIEMGSKDIVFEDISICENPSCQAIIDIDRDRLGFIVGGNIRYNYSQNTEEI